MYKNNSIMVVVPAHNEQGLIGQVIRTMPDFVDAIVVVDDASRDDTSKVVEDLKAGNDKLHLIRHDINQGVGWAIACGYKWACDNDYDVAVVMAGDAQMNPDDLPALLDPVVSSEVDYAKGNRLFTGEAFKKIPKIRYFGNSILSLLTKISSGYWHVADSQSGYTAINKKALHTIDWSTMYRRYGQPNHLLVMLNVMDFKVRDVPVEPIYNIGEKSGIVISRVIFTIGWLLLKCFLWRLKEKYVIRDFHPLVFFYLIGFLLNLGGVLLLARTLWLWLQIDHVPELSALTMMFCFTMGMQFMLFAMWFDMESNKKLK